MFKTYIKSNIIIYWYVMRGLKLILHLLFAHVREIFHIEMIYQKGPLSP